MDGPKAKPEAAAKEEARTGLLEAVKDFLTAREPGCAYFQGAEGALRFVAFAIVLAAVAAVACIV